MNEPTETEVKLYTPDLESTAARILAAGGVLQSPRVFERNVRYDAADGSLSGRGIALRLRQDARVRLTYKEPPALKDGIMSRVEVEVTVDHFDHMDLILRRLGFVPFVVYEKYRTTYTFGGTEIVLDELPFGNFAEIEGQTDQIHGALAALNLADRPRMAAGYLDLFERVKVALGLTMPDLTFAAFEGVYVPGAIFEGM